MAMSSGYEPLRRYSEAKPSRFEWAAKRIVALACIGGAAYGGLVAVKWAGHNIIGNYGREVPKAQAVSTSEQHYNQVFNHASPAGKFVMQYLRTDYVDVTQYPHAHGLVNAFLPGGLWETQFNNGCLNKTAYDIAGGSVDVTINGLFEYANVSANIPTAAAYAEINPDDANQLIVESGHSNPATLLFDGLQEGNSLVSANSLTQDILSTYGCRVGKLATNLTDTLKNISGS